MYTEYACEQAWTEFACKVGKGVQNMLAERLGHNVRVERMCECGLLLEAEPERTKQQNERAR